MANLTVEASYAEAVRYYRQGELARAEAALRGALQRAPGNAHVLHLLGMVLLQKGDLKHGLQRLQQAVAAAPGNAEFLANLGNAWRIAGQAEKAAKACRRAIRIKPNLAYAHNNLGNALVDLGETEAATEAFRRAIALEPGLTAAYANLGNCLLQAGQPDAAIAAFRQAIEREPSMTPAQSGLGHALIETGRFAEAGAAFDRAIALQPAYAEAYCGRGNLRRALQQPEAALEDFQRAVSLNPRLAVAHCCLGNALADQRQFEAAAAAFQRAIAADPRLAEAHDNLGRLLAELGRPEEALRCSRQLVRLHPRRLEYWQRFADRLRGLNFAAQDAELQADIQRCLAISGIDIEPMVPAALSLLAADPAFAALVDAGSAPVVEGDKSLLAPIALSRLQDPLLLALLPRSTLPQPRFERLLTRARHTLLSLLIQAGPASAANRPLLEFACALAQQCFRNEYIYPLAPDETAALQDLRRRLDDSPALAAQIGLFAAAVLACYAPLGELAAARRLEPSADAKGGWRALWRQQIAEPAIEASIAADIPALTESRDKISLAVRQQYEENPYPRWDETRRRIAKPAAAALREMLPGIGALADALPAAPETLIAGCGTGKQAVDAARRYAGARILAVDLSRASLAYGIRKARALGLQQIEFAQADIMELDRMPRRFDLIECTGVLHHLGDPLAGWRILIGLLQPRGLMRVALYSETARRHVVAARTYLAQRGYPATPNSIRRARQDLLALAEDHPAKPVTGYADFFTMSECRDLLFHTQERRFTLPQIATALEQLGLEFLGFELGNPSLRRAAIAAFEDPYAVRTLDAWHEFEQTHPDGFRGMYQFWVRLRTAEASAAADRQ